MELYNGELPGGTLITLEAIKHLGKSESDPLKNGETFDLKVKYSENFRDLKK